MRVVVERDAAFNQPLITAVSHPLFLVASFKNPHPKSAAVGLGGCS